MSILLLTGPPASGRITIAEQLAKQLPRCAVVDVHALRQMVANPLHEPWQGEEGRLQQLLGVNNACALVKNFVSSGFDVVILDVLSSELASLYRSELADLGLSVVLVLPSEDEVNSRLLSRPDYLSRGETDEIYAQQALFADFDQRLDNTAMAPSEAVEWLLDHWTPRFT